jgi:pimeloyl-ACP methyl ester carboxylesterase
MAIARKIRWAWKGIEVALDMDNAGNGPTVILLPALSSISTRDEMRPLFDRLAPSFRVVTVDWPGFGDESRPQIDWTPEALSAFLNWFLSEIVPPPHSIIAAGHGAGYALQHAVSKPGTIEHLALIAPTWRGPLPTMIGGHRPWFAQVRHAVDRRITGPILYRLNVSRFVVTRMANEHVYCDPLWLTGDRLAAKLAVTRAPGARHASVRFVTGSLDLVADRIAFLDLAQRARVPVLVIYGDQTPAKSRREMEALCALPNVSAKRLPIGKLSLHEEFPDPVADAVAPFLSGR